LLLVVIPEIRCGEADQGGPQQVMISVPFGWREETVWRTPSARRQWCRPGAMQMARTPALFSSSRTVGVPWYSHNTRFTSATVRGRGIAAQSRSGGRSGGVGEDNTMENSRDRAVIGEALECSKNPAWYKGNFRPRRATDLL
jgi:hypothetical protein